jgi:fimbrial chaperone protein
MRSADRGRAAPGCALAGVLIIAAAGMAAAGSFSISPIRVDLDNAHRTEFFTIHNDDDAPVVIQIRTVDWSQQNGEEQYRDSQELLTTPPVFQIAPKGEQIVRVALRRLVDPTRELSYRLFFQEVPPPSAQKLNGLSVALRLSVPVFVQPAKSTGADLQWQVHALSPRSMEVEVTNLGTAHQHVTDFDVQVGDVAHAHVNLARYVLPGAHVSWTIDVPADAAPTETVTVHGFSDAGEFSAKAAHTGS